MTLRNRSAIIAELSAAASYGLAFVLVAAAVLVRLALYPLLGAHSPYLPFTVAVIIAARSGGRGPGLAATALSVLSASYFFIEPRYSFAIASPAATGALALFAVVGISVSLLVGQLRQSFISKANSEERLLLFIEHTPAAVAMLDREMRYLAVSRRWRDDFRLGEQDLVGRLHYDVFPEISPSWREMHRRCQEGAVEKREEDPFPRADGRLDWLRWEIRPWRDIAGRIGGIIIFSELITERKRLKEQARQRAEELEKLMDVAPVAIWVAHDPQCHNITGNRMANQFYEAAEGENVSANPSPGSPVSPRRYFQGGRELSAEELPMQVAAAQGIDVRDSELEVLLPSGGRLTMFGYASPLRDAAGEVRGCVGAFLDITEHKRIEEQLHHTQKLESIGVLAGGIAHDFNNLLTTVLGNASLARLEAPPQTAAELESIMEAAQKAAALTRQLLAYAGKGNFEIRLFDLARIIRSSIDLIRVSISRNVQLVMDIPDRLPPIKGDETQVQQVVMNLVINAGEAIGSARSGTVSIRAGTSEFSPAKHAGGSMDLAPGEYVFLEVEDTGCGIDEAAQARIFEPFFTTKFTGRGLGLAAVQGVLRSHKGGIRVRSRPGEGSTFTMYLPCAAAGKPAGPGSGTGAYTVHHREATVLVVDDEPAIRRFVESGLERFGYTVLRAEDGTQALDILCRNQVDLVLLDVVMPVAGGAEVLAEIREHWPEVAVLVMSGHSRSEAHRLEAVPSDVPFIEKPFTAQQLGSAVEKVLRAVT